jgi:hypothetical protein
MTNMPLCAPEITMRASSSFRVPPTPDSPETSCSANGVFGWRTAGSGAEPILVLGRLRPFSCLVANVRLEWLKPLFLFGWRNEIGNR